MQEGAGLRHCLPGFSPAPLGGAFYAGSEQVAWYRGVLSASMRADQGAYRQVTKVNKSYRLACASGITCIACSKCLFLNIFSHPITLQFGAKSLISLKNFVATLLMNMVFLLQWKKCK